MNKVSEKMHIVAWTLALAVFWMLLSGYFKALLLIFGLLSVALVVLVVHKMDKVDKYPKPIRLNINLFIYFFWLIGQIVRSSLDVSKLVWRSPDKVAPALGVINTKTNEKTGSVLYANSITLTPGTLSVDLSEESITVHALQAESLAELQEGEMERRIITTTAGKTS